MDLQGVSDRVRCRPDVCTKGEIKRVASLAQQESQSMSQNIRIGLQYRFQQGKVQVNHSKFLGYTKDDDGLTRRFIERITVRDSGFTVMLRSGIEVEIDN